MNSNAVIDSEEFLNPERGSGGHACEMAVDMSDTEFLEPGSDVSRLMEAK